MSLDFCNCTYTTSKNENINVSMAALLKIISELPETPKLYTMRINVMANPLLPKNWIMLSGNVAAALEEAIKESKK